jgi:hypothetical protein
MMTKNTRLGLILVSAVLFPIIPIVVGIDVFVRTYDEATDQDRARGVRTRIGEYMRFEPMGMFPLPLVLALEKFPDRASCLSSDGKLLRWADIGSTLEVEVCLSRAFAKTVSDEEIVESLTANGFIGAESSPATTGRTNSAKTKIAASCTKGKGACSKALENFRHFPFEIYGYSIGISRDPPEVLNTDVVAILK